MALYDITQVMSVYFDRHLIFPLLEFLEQQQVLLCSALHHIVNTTRWCRLSRSLR